MRNKKKTVEQKKSRNSQKSTKSVLYVYIYIYIYLCMYFSLKNNWRRQFVAQQNSKITLNREEQRKEILTTDCTNIDYSNLLWVVTIFVVNWCVVLHGKWVWLHACVYCLAGGIHTVVVGAKIGGVVSRILVSECASWLMGIISWLSTLVWPILEMEMPIAKHNQRFLVKYAQCDNLLCQLFAHVNSV